MKRILKYSLFALVFMIGFSNVSAKTYTSYKEGDKITVNVNGTSKVDFYVVSDSDSSKNKVEAISKTAQGGLIEQSQINYDLLDEWTNVEGMRSINANQISSSFIFQNSLEFKAPAWAITDFPYWTNDFITTIEGKNIRYYVRNQGDYSEIALANAGSDGVAIKAYLRPVITVDKEFVVGGVTLSEDDKLWQKFTDKFKTTDLVKELKEVSGNEVNFISTLDSLKVMLKSDGKEYVTNFTYSNGVLTYVPSSTDEEKIVDSIWIHNCVLALSNMKGYDYKKVVEWLNERTDFKLATDGIEFTLKDLNISSGDSSVTLESAFTAFKLDIKNGLKDFKTSNDNKEETVENPKTGLEVLGLGTLLILCIGSIIYIKMRKYSKFPQSL